MTRHQYGISTLVSQMSFGRETSGSVAKCRSFSHAICCFGRQELRGLKLEKVGPTFSSFNAITAKMTLKIILVVVP